MSLNVRFAIAVMLLGGTGALLHTQDSRQVLPARKQFSTFPRQSGEWAGADLTIPPGTRAVLGSGDFLFRNYLNSSSDPGSVNLFLAYFPNQKIAETFHSPKHCLPGEGWIPVDSHEIWLALPGTAPFQVNRYELAKGEQRAVVLYWYQAGDRALSSEYKAKFYLISNSIRFHRSDGALIRVSTAIASNESAAKAEQRLVSLLSGIVPVLDSYVPR